jgi:secreted trypsin-like serine protease
MLVALVSIGLTIGSMAALAPSANAIVGGRLATQDYPNMAAFLEDDFQICGASLIDPQWVVTAAHCVGSTNPSPYSFRIGGVRNLGGSGGETINASKVIVHPDYDGDHDVALFKLARPSVFDPIALANPATDKDLWEPGDTARVIGYGGQVFQVPSLDEQLREVDIPMVDDAECDTNYTLTLQGGIDPRVEVCAGETLGTKDSCQGDSGGPLMARNEQGEFVQTGVVSWGFGCGFPTQYGVYSRVGDSTLNNWIQTTIATN